jgi:uncharacterized BrkB/YihY/UPF0761 family membrane protein
MSERKELNRDYIQFSKKLAKWTIISLVFIIVCAYAIISFVGLDAEQIQSVVQIVQAGSVAITLIVASYMGNSGVEKMANAKYSVNKVLNREDDEGDGAG